MAREQDTPAGRQRLVALLAVAALTAATAFAFGRIFTGRITMWHLIAASLASVGIAGLFERRGLVLTLLASSAGLVLAITWIVVPQTAWYGLPTLRTLRAVGRCLEWVAHQARVQVAPTAALPPLALAAVTATWTAAFSTHALAIRAGSPLLAVLPSLALVGFADTVLDDGARPQYAIVFLLAALFVVFVDGLRRVRQWGPIWSSARGSRVTRVASRGARRVTVGAILFALVVPGLLPGFRSEALVDFSTGGDDGIRLDPFVSIQAELDREDSIDLFRVSAPAGAYWRLYALDEFDGTTWSTSDPRAQDGLRFGATADLPASFPPSAGDLAQEVEILRDLDDPWLPMAYPAYRLSLPPGDVDIRFDPELGMAVLDGGLREGLTYSVRSKIVAPTPEELDLAAGFEPPETYGRYTDLPANVDPRVGEVARLWAGDEPTPYRQVLAIQDRFRDGSFEYTLDVEPVASSAALLDFLVNGRRGFCQQFATAMAVLVRTLGYPARVAVGFRTGAEDRGGFVVRSLDAHAWVEVFFHGFGWLPFEPTPTRSNPVADDPGTYLNPSTAGAGEPTEGGAGQVPIPGGGGTAAGGCGSLPLQVCRDAENRGGIRGGAADLPPWFVERIGGLPPAAPEEGGYSIPYRWIALSILALAGVLLLVVPVAKWALRRRVLRRARDPRALVLAAYRVFDGRAGDLGLGRRDGETVAEHRARLSAAAALSDGHLTRVVAAVDRAAYAPAPPSADEAREVARDARTAIADLRRDAGWWRRIAGTYRPGL